MQTEQTPVHQDQAPRGPVYPVQATHPMNSSRLLLELMQLGGDRTSAGRNRTSCQASGGFVRRRG